MWKINYSIANESFSHKADEFIFESSITEYRTNFVESSTENF